MTAIVTCAMAWGLLLSGLSEVQISPGRKAEERRLAHADEHAIPSVSSKRGTEGSQAGASSPSSAEDHEHQGQTDGKEMPHEHGADKHTHEHADRRIGPNKGVIESSDEVGFRLHPTAEKNFDLATVSVTGKGEIRLPRSALLHSGPRTQIFRLRGGYWKAIDITSVRRLADQVTLSSRELRPGDAVAIRGLGYLKIVEQSIKAPIPDGHVH